jgi:hypothetical protein
VDVDHEVADPPASEGRRAGRRGGLTRLVRRIIYWLAVVVISVVILVLLVRWLESHDLSSIGGTLLARAL